MKMDKYKNRKFFMLWLLNYIILIVDDFLNQTLYNWYL